MVEVGGGGGWGNASIMHFLLQGQQLRNND